MRQNNNEKGNNKERTKTQEKQVMYHVMTYHPLADAQPLTEQCSALPSNSLQFIYWA